MGGQTGMNEFGMGFVSDTSGGTTETLYIGGGGKVGKGTAWLGTLDTNSLMISKGNTITRRPRAHRHRSGRAVGLLPGHGQQHDGARVEDRQDVGAGEQHHPAAVADRPGRVPGPSRFYGGDFWVFLATGGSATVVYHVTQAGGTQPVEMLDTRNRHIVGAGVSTCAPTTPIG